MHRTSHQKPFLAVIIGTTLAVGCGGQNATTLADALNGAGGSTAAPMASGGAPVTPPPVPTTTTPPPASTAPSTGGSSGAVLDFEGSTIEICPNATPVSLPVDTFEPCDFEGCQMAHCVPEGAIPDDVPIDLLGRCADPSTICVPDDYTATFGKFLAKSCTSLLGAEGRCISTCIPQVNGLMDALPQDVCGDNERCAPCINPNDGTETGACSQGCDPGPSQETLDDPPLFETCQTGGVCTPKEIIPDALLTHLVQYECPSADYVCSPIEKAQNLKYNFPECVPTLAGIIAQPNPDGQIGGCVPAWVADANPLEGLFLAQDTCAPGDKCAPCNNPLRGNIPTGACPVPLPSDSTGGLPPDGTL